MRTISHMPSAAEVHEAIVKNYGPESPAIIDAGIDLMVSVDRTTEPPTVSVVSLDPALKTGFILDGVSVRVSADGSDYQIPHSQDAERLALEFLKRHLGR